MFTLAAHWAGYQHICVSDLKERPPSVHEPQLGDPSKETGIWHNAAATVHPAQGSPSLPADQIFTTRVNQNGLICAKITRARYWAEVMDIFIYFTNLLNVIYIRFKVKILPIGTLRTTKFYNWCSISIPPAPRGRPRPVNIQDTVYHATGGSLYVQLPTVLYFIFGFRFGCFKLSW